VQTDVSGIVSPCHARRVSARAPLGYGVVQ
jgi:hypothetical protein